nr:hypothetical protein [Tanacetum cinerariifolium]
MSDASSTVTYTYVYTDSEPWRYYREDSAETGPPRVIVYGYDGLPIHPVALPSPDYPEYPEYLEPSDDEAPLEDQPLPANASPIAASPDYVADSNQEEDPKEDPEDDQADYPADGGDDLVLPAGDTEALEADEPTHAPGSPIIILLSQTRLRRARKTVRPEPPMSASMKACIARHAALPSPPLLVPSLPLPLPSPLTTNPIDTGAPLGYRTAGIRMRALLPSTSRRTDIPEANMPPRKRACLTTPALGFKIRESFAAGAARQRTDEFEIHFEEAQDDRALLRARVNTLFRDRPDHRVNNPLTLHGSKTRIKERIRKAQQDEEANNSWDNIQAMMDADRLLVERIQAREREEFFEVQKARLLVELIEKRKKHFAALRAQEKRNKPPTK